MSTLAFTEFEAVRHSQSSRNPFHAGFFFEASMVRTLLRPVSLLAPLNGSDQIAPAIGDFYIWASDGSVALPAARYDYNSDWTPLLTGLAPVGMAASLAALEL
jgi:hypothetical protein